MGGNLALLFAEHGIEVSVIDKARKNVDNVMKMAKDESLDSKIRPFDNFKDLVNSVQSGGTPRLFVFSLPHGSPGDCVIDELSPYLKRGDIILEGANENFIETERRQGELIAKGVCYIGTGVSGGYQAARRGPSMSPGGEEHAVDAILPFLKKVAAKDSKGRRCVANMGFGGSGHYVKTVHNGIEQGMLSVICEAWGIMVNHLGMEYNTVSKVFEKWNAEGELVLAALLQF